MTLLSLLRRACVPALVVLLSGCKESPVVAEVGVLADKMCACQDAACAETARAETVEYQKAHRQAMVSRDDNKKVDAHMQRAKACLEALAKPVADAAAEGGPPAAPRPAEGETPRP